ncbi:MAG: M20/M25/M40 family metallo-hydrolase [Bacteroidales bacterium]
MISFTNGLLLFANLIIFSSCSFPSVKEPDITTEELRHHIEYLASDTLDGRYPGTAGDSMAAAYIRDRFMQSGLLPGAEDGFQYFSIVTGISAGPNNSITVNDSSMKQGTDFTPFPFSANSELTAEAVFCGYGFSVNEHNMQWDDYKEVDVNGKWVMALRGDPEPDDPASIFANHGNDRYKAYLAAEKGAAGMILVSGRKFDMNDELVDIGIHQGKVAIPVIQVTRQVADIILAQSGSSLEVLEEGLANDLRPESFYTNTTITASTDLIVNDAETMNVTGIIRGNDPVLKNEYILIGAHYDHLGTGGEGSSSRRPGTITVHPGADDNASGVAAMIEIAERLSAERQNHRRSYIFVAFGAEEKGLLGSKYFIENPVVETGAIKTMINLDMVGRLNEDRILQVGGTGTSMEGDAIIGSLNSDYRFTTALSPEGSGPSDHASFYAAGIPVFFFSTGAHMDYHTPDDTAEKINYEGLKKVADFVCDLATSLGSMDDHLSFQEAGPRSPAAPRHGNRRVTLGIMPDFTSTDSDGLRAEMVTPGRPADLGGMKNGDIIVAINGDPVKDIYEYMFRLQQLNPGEIINVEVLRGEKKEILIIHLE